LLSGGGVGSWPLPLSDDDRPFAEATGYLKAGYQTVVDLDLAKFFDRVHHQRLLARIADRVKDQRIIKLSVPGTGAPLRMGRASPTDRPAGCAGGNQGARFKAAGRGYRPVLCRASSSAGRPLPVVLGAPRGRRFPYSSLTIPKHLVKKKPVDQRLARNRVV
jgi:hypothetical protein